MATDRFRRTAALCAAALLLSAIASAQNADAPTFEAFRNACRENAHAARRGSVDFLRTILRQPPTNPETVSRAREAVNRAWEMRRKLLAAQAPLEKRPEIKAELAAARDRSLAELDAPKSTTEQWTVRFDLTSATLVTRRELLASEILTESLSPGAAEIRSGEVVWTRKTPEATERYDPAAGELVETPADPALATTLTLSALPAPFGLPEDGWLENGEPRGLFRESLHGEPTVRCRLFFPDEGLIRDLYALPEQNLRLRRVEEIHAATNRLLKTIEYRDYREAGAGAAVPRTRVERVFRREDSGAGPGAVARRTVDRVQRLALDPDVFAVNALDLPTTSGTIRIGVQTVPAAP